MEGVDFGNERFDAQRVSNKKERKEVHDIRLRSANRVRGFYA